jgi:hypothetical protein
MSAASPARPTAGTRAPAIVVSAETATPANLVRAIAFLHLMGTIFHVPLFEAVARDEIALSMVQPRQAPPLGRLDKTGRPAVLIISDDDDHTRLGPQDWPCVARVMRWAGAALIHGSGGKPEHYKLAVRGVLSARRLVLVETSSWRVDAWTEAALRSLPKHRVLRIEPPEGGIHPIMPTLETIQ